MRILIIKKDKIDSQILPLRVYGNYWITDQDKNGNIRNLINIEGVNGNWQINSNFEAEINLNGKRYESAVLRDYCFCNIKILKTNELLTIYCEPVFEVKSLVLDINSDIDLTIGSGNSCSIKYNNLSIGASQSKLFYKNKQWTLENVDLKRNVYINNEAVLKSNLKYGDVIFIMGLKIIVLKDKLLVNNPNNQVSLNINGCVAKAFLVEPIEHNINMPEEEEIMFFDKKDYFFRAPRFRSPNAEEEFKVDPPTQPEKADDMPMIYTVGPMITMAMTSMITAFNAINKISKGESTFADSWPSIVTAAVMLLSTLLWPSLTKAYNKKRKKEKEELRWQKYGEYIEEKRNTLLTKLATKKQIMIENILPLNIVKNIIDYKDRKLWERKVEHDDFLVVRLGIGDIDSPIKMELPEEHFTLEEDKLAESLERLGEDTKQIKNVPIPLNLAEKRVSAIVGSQNLTIDFINGLILQLAAFHSYENLKIIFYTTEENQKKWEYLKTLPHCWSDNRDVRFFCSNLDEFNQLSSYFDEMLFYREFENGDPTKPLEADYKSYNTYYLLITDDFKSIKGNKLVERILDQPVNYGFGLLICSERLLGLPNQCTTFINVDSKISGMIENELTEDKQRQFAAEFATGIDMEEYAKKLANIPIETEGETYNLPKTISFLEMYDVGKVAQLNPLARWKSSNPIASLQAPVGVDENGNLFKLDLHEKFHGPHGLIAGMTGSGKSEFIITYVLSMAVNYNPNEVAFVLIDYKGGGLTNAFENRRTGLRLPHLAGTLTNLDVSSMNRALASVESELKRRQRIFNDVSEQLGESTIDIYKYQKLYREGTVTTPLPHLFIITDEFAELKLEQPDFMSELISISRIGRSLGIHLILATQKPSGVVDDQIWSNSKFRVCLKVQTTGDSNDMLKRPEAADLKDAGRFYLQVGHNELFMLGQSAWCGAPYKNTEKIKKKIDTSIDYINNIGYSFKNVDNKSLRNMSAKSYGDELSNIVNYICDSAKRDNIYSPKLWLDPIPEHIYVPELINKYNWERKPHFINPVIGEYDDPEGQSQHLLTMPLSKNGNAIIIGSSGSGKENLLSTLVFSTIIKHNGDEVNFYIIDCGAGTLKVYEPTPQVDDVLSIEDDEKIENLFKFIDKKITERKKMFYEYGGDYQNYCNSSGNIIPTIIVIINSYDLFIEKYPLYEDIIIQFTREGFKYGIIFVLSISGATGIRFKLDQNFALKYVLNLNQEDDYSLILGNTGKKYPAKIKGRGLIKIDKIYEFQTAEPLNSTDLNEDIKIAVKLIQGKANVFADRIPVLPDVVTLDYVNEEENTLNNLPVALSKEEIAPLKFDFKNQLITLVLSQDGNAFNDFTSALATQFIKTKNSSLVVIDTKEIINNIDLTGALYYKEKFDDIIEKLYNYVTKLDEIFKKSNYDIKEIEKYQNTVCLITGPSIFISSLSEEVKTKFNNIMEMCEKMRNKIIFVMVDTSTEMKKLEYEPWYKNVNAYNGIWIGGDIESQFVLKVTKYYKYLKDELTNQYGYVVTIGNPVQAKLIGIQKEELDDK